MPAELHKRQEYTRGRRRIAPPIVLSTDLQPPPPRPVRLKALASPPAGDRWPHEMKYDDYSALIAVGVREGPVLPRSVLDPQDRYLEQIGDLSKTKRNSPPAVFQPSQNAWVQLFGLLDLQPVARAAHDLQPTVVTKGKPGFRNMPIEKAIVFRPKNQGGGVPSGRARPSAADPEVLDSKSTWR